MFNFVKRPFLKKDFFMFLIIGGINTLGGTFYSIIFSLFLQTNLAFIVGYIAALIIAYFLNSFFVFHVKTQWIKFVKFIISYIPNFIIQNVIVLAFYNWLGINKYVVYIIAAAIGIPVTFLILKMFTLGIKSLFTTLGAIPESKLV